jgi:plastocyanin
MKRYGLTLNFLTSRRRIPAHKEIRAMSTQSIQIRKNLNPTPSQPATFAPREVVASAGDNVTWHNADQEDHWPAPSASNPAGWLQFRIPPGSESRGDVALAGNSVVVTAATNANPVVLTLKGPAPATGAPVTITYATPKAPAPPAPAPPASPWAVVKGRFVATNVGPNSCSIPLDSSNFGPFSPVSGTITMALPYTLNYVCALHPAETGTITVNPQQ